MRRVITRLSDGVTEVHDRMTPEAFEAGRAAGTFCLSWGAHGLFYGLPKSALDAVDRGRTVVANVSRTALSEAVRTFGRVAVVEITADPEILVERIIARGREECRRSEDGASRGQSPSTCHMRHAVTRRSTIPVHSMSQKDQLIKILSSSSY